MNALSVAVLLMAVAYTQAVPGLGYGYGPALGYGYAPAVAKVGIAAPVLAAPVVAKSYAAPIGLGWGGYGYGAGLGYGLGVAKVAAPVVAAPVLAAPAVGLGYGYGKVW